MTQQFDTESAPGSEATQLAHYLWGGGQLSALDRSSLGIQTRPDEHVYAVLPVTVQQFIAAGDGTYLKKGGIPLSPVGAVLRVGMAVGNSRRKSKAEKLSREEWRSTAGGQLFVGDQRLIMQLNQSWDVIERGSVMAVQFDGDAIIVQMTGRDAIRLIVPAPDYYFVMVHTLIFGEPVLPPAAR